MTTKKEIYNAGERRGYDLANWQELPKIGEVVVPGDIDWCGTIESVADAKEVFLQRCYMAEESSRQFSPFEFVAKELNDLAETKPYDPWDVFEEGICGGIRASWQERKKHYKGSEK